MKENHAKNEVYEKIDKLHPGICGNYNDILSKIKNLGIFLRYIEKLAKYIRKIRQKPDVKF